MMLLMPFISRLSWIIKVKSFVVLMLLQGCSSLEDNEKNGPDDLDSLGKDIVDMVDVPASDKKVVDDIVSMAPPKHKTNLYLEEAQQHLADVPVQIQATYQQALALMKNKQWQAAEKLFDQILVTQPQLSGVYINKALIAVNQQALSRASEHVDKALAVNPMNPYAHQLKGKISRLTGQFSQAEKSYLAALAIWPTYPEAQINLAILLELYRGRLLDARKYYAAYLALQPDDIQVQRWLAGVEIKIKRAGLILPKKAEGEALRSSVTASPQSSAVTASGEG